MKTASQHVEELHVGWLEADGPHWGDRIDWGSADAIAAQLDVLMAPDPEDCRKAPEGHYCVHQAGHDGPCRVFAVPGEAV